MQRFTLFVMCLSLALAAGCRREVRATVSGKIDYEGQPLNSGYVTFQVNNLVTRGGDIGKDGSYKVDGLPFGSAVVAIYVEGAPPPVPEGITPTAVPGTYEENPVLIPKKYETLETSGITVQVAMPEQSFDIHLEKPEKKRR